LRVGGHRGSSAVAPENTAAAFERSLRDGAEYVETDIQRSSDGHLVLMHDPTIDRTTDGSGPVASKTLAELEALDAGSWFDASFAGQRVLRFESFIEWVESNAPFGAALEVKARGVGGDVARLAWGSSSRDNLAIYSFLEDEIVAAKAAAPDLPAVLLLHLFDQPGEVLARFERIGADGADVPWQWNARDLLDGMRERGLLIGGGSSDGDQAAQALLDQGVDMIDTDKPADMIGTVRRLTAVA
jgi:glycerophosphoryl diester phosphodiesterase